MTITLNGQPRDLPEGATIQSVLAELKLTPDKVAVELNRRLVRAAGYGTPLKEGDVVEVVTFVGGG
jgi:thiamine biosynthesis protein ThiS